MVKINRNVKYSHSEVTCDSDRAVTLSRDSYFFSKKEKHIIYSGVIYSSVYSNVFLICFVKDAFSSLI